MDSPATPAHFQGHTVCRSRSAVTQYRPHSLATLLGTPAQLLVKSLISQSHGWNRAQTWWRRWNSNGASEVRKNVTLNTAWSLAWVFQKLSILDLQRMVWKRNNFQFYLAGDDRGQRRTARLVWDDRSATVTQIKLWSEFSKEDLLPHVSLLPWVYLLFLLLRSLCHHSVQLTPHSFNATSPSQWSSCPPSLIQSVLFSCSLTLIPSLSFPENLFQSLHLPSAPPTSTDILLPLYRTPHCCEIIGAQLPKYFINCSLLSINLYLPK